MEASQGEGPDVPGSSMSKRFRQVFQGTWIASGTLLLLSLTLTVLQAYRTPPINIDATCCDHLFYRSMAFNFFTVSRPDLNEPPPGNRLSAVYADRYFGGFMHRENKLNRQPPYCYRFVTPLLSRAIATVSGRSIDFGFYTLSFASLAFTCFVLALSVYDISRNWVLAAAAAISYSEVYSAFSGNLHDYMLTDPLAQLFVALSVYFMLTERKRWFLAIGLVAIFNKEIHAFMLPCYVLMEFAERRTSTSVLIGCVLIVATYAAFRLWLPVPTNTYSLATTFFRLPSAATIATEFFQVFGVLAVSAVIRLPFRRATLSLTPIAIGAAIAELFAPNTARTYAYAFPFVMLATFGVPARSGAAKVLAIVPALIFLAQRPASWSAPLITLYVMAELAFVAVTAMDFARQRRCAPQPDPAV